MKGKILILNNENWLEYAISVYDTANNMDIEIYDDLKQIQNLKKYFNAYLRGNDKFARSIINTVIMLNNNFTAKGAYNLLVFKLDKIYYPLIKTCYCYLKLIDVNGDGIKIYSSTNNDLYMTPIDNKLLKLLHML